ncbi:hypothetical protein ACQFX9_06185 [Aliinostoc sp. HNIBRCY26]
MRIANCELRIGLIYLSNLLYNLIKYVCDRVSKSSAENLIFNLHPT